MVGSHRRVSEEHCGTVCVIGGLYRYASLTGREKARGNTRNAQPHTGLSILPLVWVCGSRYETFSAALLPIAHDQRCDASASLQPTWIQSPYQRVLMRAGLPKGQAFDEVA